MILEFIRKFSKEIKYFALGSSISGAGVQTANHYITDDKKEQIQNIYYINNASEDFRLWFNDYRKDKIDLYPNKIDSTGFHEVFNNINKFSYNRNGSLTLQEFLCYFFTFYNETGGLFKSISERGQDSYFFENSLLKWGGYKRSYNTLNGNIPAGTYMYSLGIITTETEKQIWNGTTYPINENSRIKFTARNCDFYKYRGQGLIQLTGRNNFDAYVKPILPNVHELSYLQLQNEFKKPEVYLPSIKNYIKGAILYGNKNLILSKIEDINTDNPEWDKFGHIISGKSQYHYFKDRCNDLYININEKGFYNIFYPKDLQ